MKTFFLIIIVFFALQVFSQKSGNEFIVMFYNVENLFDTIDNPKKSDNNFLPSSKKQWDTKKYQNKVQSVSKVIVSVDSLKLPDVIGLCEVENKEVLVDLISSNHQIKSYQIVHQETSDSRGIDMALLYNPNTFIYISHSLIPVKSISDKNEQNREILYVKGRGIKNDTLHIFINHWKSRVGGQEKTEIKRVFYAMALKNKIDSILIDNPMSNVIVMGDFNDDPENKSIFQILQSNNKRKNRETTELFNLFFDLHNYLGAGTLVFENQWYLFDQIMVSNHLLINSKGMYTRPDSGQILQHEWLVKKTGKLVEPFSTYDSNEYLGGYSDHLPVFVKFYY